MTAELELIPPTPAADDPFESMSGMTNGATTAITAPSTASSAATARAAGLRETTRAERQTTVTAAAIVVITHHGQPMSTVRATATGRWYVALPTLTRTGAARSS